jgi:hypothetical protein
MQHSSSPERMNAVDDLRDILLVIEISELEDEALEPS